MAVPCSFNWLGAIINLASIIIGGFIGFWSARRVSVFDARRHAYSDLWAALAPVCLNLRQAKKALNEIRTARGSEQLSPDQLLDRFYSEPNPNFQSLTASLEDSLYELSLAFERFQPFVSKKNYAPWRKACDEYVEAAQLGSSIPEESSLANIQNDDPLAKIDGCVRNLIKYADYPKSFYSWLRSFF